MTSGPPIIFVLDQTNLRAVSAEVIRSDKGGCTARSEYKILLSKETDTIIMRRCVA